LRGQLASRRPRIIRRRSPPGATCPSMPPWGDLSGTRRHRARCSRYPPGHLADLHRAVPHVRARTRPQTKNSAARDGGGEHLRPLGVEHSDQNGGGVRPGRCVLVVGGNRNRWRPRLTPIARYSNERSIPLASDYGYLSIAVSSDSSFLKKEATKLVEWGPPSCRTW